MPITCAGCGGPLIESKVPHTGHCPNCNHYAILSPIGTRKYDLSYLRKYDGYEMTPLGRKVNRSRWNLVERYLEGRRRILDWGCGNGSFVRASRNGFDVRGYDVNPFGQFGNISLYRERWDAVTLWDVIEHMEDPFAFVSGLSTGYLFILTPDVGGAPTEMKGWKHFRPDEHQHYFSINSMSRMLSRAGYDLREINRDEAALRDELHPEYLVTFVAQK